MPGLELFRSAATYGPPGLMYANAADLFRTTAGSHELQANQICTVHPFRRLQHPARTFTHLLLACDLLTEGAEATAIHGRRSELSAVTVPYAVLPTRKGFICCSIPTRFCSASFRPRC